MFRESAGRSSPTHYHHQILACIHGSIEPFIGVRLLPYMSYTVPSTIILSQPPKIVLSRRALRQTSPIYSEKAIMSTDWIHSRAFNPQGCSRRENPNELPLYQTRDESMMQTWGKRQKLKRNLSLVSIVGLMMTLMMACIIGSAFWR